MRLDKYLKVSRVIKRRTLANEVADAGRVLVNGKPAKASYTVKLGDIIEVTFGNRPVKIRVLSDVEQKGKDVAREMFEIIEGIMPRRPARGSLNAVPAAYSITVTKQGRDCHAGNKTGAARRPARSSKATAWR